MPEPTGQPDWPATSSAQRQYEHHVDVTFTVNAPDASLAVSAVKRVLTGAQLIGLTVHSPQREALILSWRLAGTVAPAPAAEPTGPSCTTMGHEHLAATHVGRYDDGQTVEDGVAYCAECATVMRGEFTPAAPTGQPDRPVFEQGDVVRCWPGARPGRSYVARVITGKVVDFCGTPTLWIAKPASEGGGHDHLALTHVAPASAAERTGPDSERTAKRERLARAVAVALVGDLAATDPPTPSAYAAADAALAVINGRDDLPAEPTGQQRAAEGLARHLTPAQRLADAQAQVAALHADVERLTAERDRARDNAFAEAAAVLYDEGHLDRHREWQDDMEHAGDVVLGLRGGS